jgi:hypothetical protein
MPADSIVVQLLDLYWIQSVSMVLCSFIRSCSGAQHLEFGICFSHKFESQQAQSVIYPFRSMRFVCHSARNAIDVLNLNYS